MLNVAFCEVDPVRNAYLGAMLRDYANRVPMHIHAFQHPAAFIAYIDRYGDELDILLTNIVMGEFNGIQLMRIVQERLPEIEILFVSQYKELVFDAYAVRHAAFIPAPIEAQYFYQGMDRAVKNLERRHKAYLTLSSRGIISRIDLDDILYMESNLKQLCVHTRRGAQEFPRQLESVKPLLDHRFVQCHKSFIVNMDHVADLDIAAMCMNLSTGGAVPVSSRKLKETRDAFLNYSAESPHNEE